MSFSPRLVRPGAGNKYYIRQVTGGWNPSIAGYPTDKDCNVLHNCVGYALGRFNEIGNYGCCKYLKPYNAEQVWDARGDLQVSQNPALGACAVWKCGSTATGSDGAGHVAIVEQIHSADEITTSESGYGAQRPFWTQRRKRGTGNWGQNASYQFLGFILNPAVEDKPVEPAPKKKQTIQVAYKRDLKYSRAYTVNATAGLNLRTGAGTDFQIIKTLKYGTTVRCYGYYNLDRQGKPWLYLTVNGTLGYATLEYLK